MKSRDKFSFILGKDFPSSYEIGVTLFNRKKTSVANLYRRHIEYNLFYCILEESFDYRKFKRNWMTVEEYVGIEGSLIIRYIVRTHPLYGDVDILDSSDLCILREGRYFEHYKSVKPQIATQPRLFLVYK